MIIKGSRRGGASKLTAHLLRQDTNEDVIVREVNGCSDKALSGEELARALRVMEVQGRALNKKQMLYHAIIAPQAGEILTGHQLKQAVDTLAANLGLAGNNRAVVEHRKSGRQHFHIVFNILSPEGKQARLQWTRKKEWATCRQLEEAFGLKSVMESGRPARRWEHERGKRSGINPLKVRTEITAIYRNCTTGREFVTALSKAGYVLCLGRNNRYVLVDQAGDVHGLLRRIEGVKLGDFRKKFPDLGQMVLPSPEAILQGKQLVRRDKPQRLQPKRPPARQVSFVTSRLSGAQPYRKSAPSYTGIYHAMRYAALMLTHARQTERQDQSLKPVRPWRYNRRTMEADEIIAWAFKNGRLDVLALYGIILPPDFFEP